MAMYGTGDFANPVKALEELVAIYGGKKPIMITETGVENFSTTNNEDVTEWAAIQMIAIYHVLPMVFPEVKAMFYFNVDRSAQGETSRYSLFNAPRTNQLYADLTMQGHFIRGLNGAATVSYTKLGTATVPANAVRLHVYAPFYHLEGIKTVDFLVNGNAHGTSNIAPYTQQIDFSGYADGDLALRVNVFVDGRLVNFADYNVRKSGGFVTLSEGPAVGGGSGGNQPTGPVGGVLGDVLYSDVRAVINGNAIPSFNIDGNTMVIAEDLWRYGFDVTWDGETATLRVASFDAAAPTDPIAVGPQAQPGGTFRMHYLSTNVKTFVAGAEITGYNIGGQTIIQFDHLAAYGEVAWDGGTRTISLTTR
jgi:hypothetical protein